jgi:hypothetical protein
MALNCTPFLRAAGSNCGPASQETRRSGGERTRHGLWYRWLQAAVAAEAGKQEVLRRCVRSDRNEQHSRFFLLRVHHKHAREEVQNPKQDLG